MDLLFGGARASGLALNLSGDIFGSVVLAHRVLLWGQFYPQEPIDFGPICDSHWLVGHNELVLNRLTLSNPQVFIISLISISCW